MPDTVRCWLVERDYDERNLVTVVYATPDGEQMLRRQRSASVLEREGGETTAAVDADPDALEPVPEGRRQRYAREAERMAETRRPDDAV